MSHCQLTSPKDGHTVHKLSQRCLTADWLAPKTVTVHKLIQRRLTADLLAPLDSDCSRMRSKFSSDWLSSYIKATRTVLEIFKMARYFPDSPRIYRLYREISEQDRREGHTAVRLARLDVQTVPLSHPIPCYRCTYCVFVSQVSFPSKKKWKKERIIS